MVLLLYLLLLMEVSDRFFDYLNTWISIKYVDTLNEKVRRNFGQRKF